MHLEDFQPAYRPRWPVETITVGASPYTYTASKPGFVLVSGGTVSSIALSRDGGATTTDFGLTSGCFPVAALDQIIITHTGAPTANFVAN